MVQTITICTLKKNVYKSNDTHIHFNHSRLLIQEHTCGRHCSRARSNETYRQSADRPLSVSQGVYISSLRDPTCDHITSSDRQLFSYPSKSAIGPYPALDLALDCQNLKNLRNNFCHLFRVRTSPSLSIASLYM